MRSCRPARGPNSKPVLIVAATANSIGRAGRPLRPKRNPFGRGPLPRGWSSNGTVDVASVEGVGRRPRPCGGVATICHIHDTTSSGRCGRGRGSFSPAKRRVTKVSRQGVAAGDCSRVTASASRLAERRPSVGEVAVPPRPKGRSALARIEQALAPPSATMQKRGPARTQVYLCAHVPQPGRAATDRVGGVRARIRLVGNPRRTRALLLARRRGRGQ
jgi:hypothetical protein